MGTEPKLRFEPLNWPQRETSKSPQTCPKALSSRVRTRAPCAATSPEARAVLQSIESAGQSGAAPLHLPSQPATATSYHAPETTLRLCRGTRGGGGCGSRHHGRDAPRDSLGSDYREGAAVGPAGKMPVAVMAEGAFSFKKLLDQCENQELEVTVRVELRETSGSLPARAAPVSRVTGPGASGRGWGRAPRVWRRGLVWRLRIWLDPPRLAGSFLSFVFSE